MRLDMRLNQCGQPTSKEVGVEVAFYVKPDFQILVKSHQLFAPS